jgi:hypothetical protein
MWEGVGKLHNASFVFSGETPARRLAKDLRRGRLRLFWLAGASAGFELFIEDLLFFFELMKASPASTVT